VRAKFSFLHIALAIFGKKHSGTDFEKQARQRPSGLSAGARFPLYVRLREADQGCATYDLRR
jgi:hypothetical protein